MGTERSQIAVRLETWHIEAIKKFAERNNKDFSGALRFLLECELNRRSYYRTDFEPDIVDQPLNNETEETVIFDMKLEENPENNEKTINKNIISTSVLAKEKKAQ